MTQKTAADQKAIVVQYGARRMYALPSSLALAGRLERFYTDFALTPARERFVPLVEKLLPRAKAPLARRRLPKGIAGKTTTFPRWTLELSRGTKLADPAKRVRAIQKAHARSDEAMIRKGLGNATHVLSVFGEGAGLLRHAKERGLTICIDVNIAFSTETILAEEAKRHPGWGKTVFFDGGALSSKDSIRAFILGIADRLLCPSDFVARDLIENYGVPPERIRLVPYAVSDFWLEVENRPEPGRILFAGSPDLRKGIHVLAEMAQILQREAPDCEVVVAGRVSEAIASRPECSALTFLGPLPTSGLRAEMARADVFCFPSLAEGSAGVTYEALAAGVPLVTTGAAGSVVQDGISGSIVPASDPEATARAVLAIIRDRNLRQQMSVAARDRARDHGWTQYGERLLQAVFE